MGWRGAGRKQAGPAAARDAGVGPCALPPGVRERSGRTHGAVSDRDERAAAGTVDPWDMRAGGGRGRRAAAGGEVEGWSRRPDVWRQAEMRAARFPLSWREDGCIGRNSL